jgi:hypothetical protein
MPNTASVFAAEGTAAHGLASTCLEQGKDASWFFGHVFGPNGWVSADAAEADGESLFEVTEEMADAVQSYLDLCRQFMSPPWEYEIEQRLDLTAVHKDVFGTGDFLAYNPVTKNLVVVDYKHGKGHAVTVEQNKQLLTYGLGATLRHHNRGIDAIDLYIVQPRCPHPEGPERHARYDAVDLLEFQIALADAATATEAADAPLVAGDHCKFCPAAGVCPEFRRKATALAEEEFSVSEVSGLSGEKLAEILRQAGLLKDWIKRVEAYAQQEAQHGRLPTGFKLVAKRATRKWRNPEDARAYLSTVLDLEDEQIFAEPKMKSPAQIESLIGKKRAKTELDGLWEAVSSGANLVPEDDARPALKSTAEEEFA